MTHVGASNVVHRVKAPNIDVIGTILEFAP